MPGPNVFQKNIAHPEHCTVSVCFDVISSPDKNTHKAIQCEENVIHQTRSSSFIALWYCFDAYVPVVGTFSSIGVCMSALTCVWLRSLKCTNCNALCGLTSFYESH